MASQTAPLSAFFAYSARQDEVVQSIVGAMSILSTSRRAPVLHLWQENDISGRLLTDPIFNTIGQLDFLIADITTLNFNVTFEIGYAIGLRKRVFLVRNSNFRRETSLIDTVGIFDTLGFQSYSDPLTLAGLIEQFDAQHALPLRTKPNTKTPVYVLQTPQSNSAMISITARIKRARLGYKGYIPSDESRLSAGKAIDDVSECIGAVIPLLSMHFADAEVHNIRAAFVSGLAKSMQKRTLVLQPREGPAPLDVRDIVTTYSHPNDIIRAIADFALDITEKLQEEDPLPLPKGNFLGELSIGDSVAENEFQTLGRYYLQLDQFKRAARGEINMVVGRKGTGKTALFAQLRNEKRANSNSIVVDLKPEGYQLIKLRENVLDFLAEGARIHLITALFEYVLLLEICYKVLEKDRERHTRDSRLYEPYLGLSLLYNEGEAGEGDFSERLQNLAQSLIDAFEQRHRGEAEIRLKALEVTELVYKHDIKALRDTLRSYLRHKDGVWILFDNLDKGWSPQGLSPSDLLILRCLIDAARKIQRQLQRERIECHSLVFVRNDVYQLLIEKSADYGKESRAALDWTDPDLLREMLRRRLVHNNLPPDTPFDRVWGEICTSHYHGEESSQYLIDRSLMRPRNLIKLLTHCRSFAVGLEHSRIEESDLDKGLRAYSLDLIVEADQELTDIVGHETNLMYHFIGEGDEFMHDKLIRIVRGAGVPGDKAAGVIEYLLYYGFIGVRMPEGGSKYIFDVGYDMKMFKIIVTKQSDNIIYLVNPAFSAGLNL